MIFLTIIAVIVIFSLLVLIHEFGHFIAARKAGIRVLEFGIGFPPRIFKKKIGETIYSINAIPFGGFVKMHGEDAVDAEVLKSPDSFASKTKLQRAIVVLAGVAMNFILAIALLTIGFSFGIEPLLVTQDDLFRHIAEGNVASAPGIFIKSAPYGGKKIIAIDDHSVTDESQLRVFSKGNAERDIDLAVSGPAGSPAEKIHIPLIDAENKDLGIKLLPYTRFPRLTILEVRPFSGARKAGFSPGDTILDVNGLNVYYESDFYEALGGLEGADASVRVLRNNEIIPLIFSIAGSRRVVIADVFAGSSAQAAGFQKADIIIKIDGEEVSSISAVQNLISANPSAQKTYALSRGGREVKISAAVGRDNLLGIALSYASSYRNADFSLYQDSILTSITEIKRVKYAPWQAFKSSLSESARLTGITVKTFASTIGSIVSRFTVPEDIGGPVQIAYYTHAFIKEGFFALLRFTALLSLSLAVINILPLPALDGGRFLFILMEVITGRRVNARLESFVHMIGFALLLILIGVVTYSDIVRLF